MRPIPTLLIALACLGTGMLIGAWLPRMTTEAPAVRPSGVSRSGGETDEATAPMLKGRNPGSDGARTRSGLGKGAAGRDEGEDAQEAAPPFGGEGTFEVLVTDADGKRVEAHVTANPRGVSEWDEAPAAYHSPVEGCRLVVPAPGMYDLHARATNPPGSAGLPNMTIRSGETVSVHLTFETAPPIRFVPGPTWAGGAPLDRGRWSALIDLVAPTAPGWRVDPDEQGDALRFRLRLDPPGGPWTTPRVPAGLEYEIRSFLRESSRKSGEPRARPPFRIRVEPRVARSGDTVTLHADPVAYVELRFDLHPAEGWPEAPMALEASVEQDGTQRTSTWRVRSPGAFARAKRPWVLSGRPGPMRLRWDGPGIAAGTLEDLVLVQGRPIERRVTLELDVTELPSREPLLVEIRGPTTDDLNLVALLPAEEGRDPPELDWFDTARESVELNAAWRRASHIVAYSGRFASRPVPVPPRGPMSVTLEATGHLIVVPERLPYDEMTTLRIRRSDGLPFLTSGDMADYPAIRTSVRVRAGDIVGPLPAGRYVFQVDVMGLRRPDAAVEVKAGRVGVLPIR